MNKILRALCLGILMTPALFAASSPQPAKIIDTYSGGFKDDYPQALVRVRTYVLSTQSDLATLFGLQYGQGFLHPVEIRFDDGSPAASENPFFYVQMKGTGETFSQVLVVNVEAFATKHASSPEKESTLRGGFRYAVTQVMLNDIAAGNPAKTLPLWAQEGLSVYASGDGEAFLREIAEHVRKSNVKELVGKLNNPSPFLVTKDWALYYSAIKYIAAQGALQPIVRGMTTGKSAPDAVREATSLEWPEFENRVRASMIQALESYAQPDSDAAPTPKSSR